MGYQNLHAVAKLRIEKVQHVVSSYELDTIEFETHSYQERTYLGLMSRLTSHSITQYRYLHIIEYGLSESEYTPPLNSPASFPLIDHDYDLIVLDWEYVPTARTNKETREALKNFFKHFENIAIKPHPSSSVQGFCEAMFSFPVLPSYIPAETLSNPKATALAKETSTVFHNLILLDDLLGGRL
jgi:hypothetical protein